MDLTEDQCEEFRERGWTVAPSVSVFGKFGSACSLALGRLPLAYLR